MSDKLGDMLLQSKLISKEQLASALEYQKAIGGKLGVILVKLNFIKETTLTEFLSDQQKIPIVQVKDHRLDPEVIKLIPRDFAEKHEFLPLSRDGEVLTVVTPDPMDYQAIDELTFTTGLKIQTVLATRTEVTKALQSFYYGDKAARAGAAPPAAAPAKPQPPVTDTPAKANPVGAAGPAAKRGRAVPVGPSPLMPDLSAPLEPRQIDVDTEKLVQALVGLLVEKQVVTLGEVMDRVARRKA
jgi:type II secretory ATPase GspE/PulE/Tfp pilus assembly ATPase PilB-like protein